ncbi:hypothetical protein E2C01_040202 [Portunus trituberculatus]|uniref:Uncharacterized protein n=1 Tax=Portunus trituberculatus TaxID=210409 RepID=A0A5B7FJ22_PORTR|nr:hypothetical protein [Portunus trituberculatus]
MAIAELTECDKQVFIMKNQPRIIVAHFCRYADRQQALRNFANLKEKDTNIYLYEDLCEVSVQKRKAQLPTLRKARAEGKNAYFSYTKLIIRERRERTFQHSTTEDSTPHLPNVHCPTRTMVAFAPASSLAADTSSATAGGDTDTLEGAVGGNVSELEAIPKGKRTTSPP